MDVKPNSNTFVVLDTVSGTDYLYEWEADVVSQFITVNDTALGDIATQHATSARHTTLFNATTSDVTITSGSILSQAASTALTVMGDYTNNGTYTAGASSTVLLAGVSQQTIAGTVTGASSFENLTITNTSGSGDADQSVIFSNAPNVNDTLTFAESTSAQFPAGATTTVEDFVIEDSPIFSTAYLRSSSDGTQWALDVNGTSNIAGYVDVKDSDACDSTSNINVLNGQGTDSGNNDCWTFIGTGLSSTTVIVITDTSSTTWTVPDDFSTVNTIHVIGAGGSGGSDLIDASAGGGGGAYAYVSNLNLTPGASVSINIGAGGTAGAEAGEDTWLGAVTCGAASVCAGGGGAPTDASPGGAGGTVVVGTGFAGGTGGTGGGGADDGGGGGGGAAGPNGAGANGGSSSNSGGAGGGGADGGSAGTNGGSTVGGYGGDGPSGSGGGDRNGVDGDANTGGGGGGGNDNGTENGGDGGTGDGSASGTGWGTGYGPGGGGGGGADAGEGGNGGLYGGGGGGYGEDGTTSFGDGGQGIIVITYETVNEGTSGTLTVDDHTVGQVANAFETDNGTQVPLLGFQLTATDEAMSITNPNVEISGARNVDENDFSNIALYIDEDSDGLFDSGGDTFVATGTMDINSRSGEIDFTTELTVASGSTTDYIMIADYSNIPRRGQITFDFYESDILYAVGEDSGVNVVPGISVRPANHIYNTGGGGGGGVGTAPPSGDGDVGGGTNEGGELIGSDPNFNSPTANSGSWTNPSNAYDDTDGTYASDNTGTTNNFSDHGFSINGANDIDGIAIKLEISGTTAAGDIGIELSWDGGTSWTASGNSTPTLTTTDAVTTVGGASDLWGRAWAPSEFSDANFRVRLTGNPSSNTVQVDALQVRIYNSTTGGGSGGGGGGI